MTEPLKLDAFEKLRGLLGVCSFKHLEQERLVALGGFVMVEADEFDDEAFMMVSKP